MILLPPLWELPPEDLTCTDQAIHLWLVRLDIAESQYRYLGDLLSPDEQQRAKKFTFDQHRARFIAGRGFLRSILGKYLQMEPAQIRFQYNTWGKPALDPSLGINTFHFNLSHSNGLALFAFTQAGPIGVDIENIRPQTDIEQTGALVFSSSELAALQSLSPEIRRITFFQFWTRKEAFMKAKGDGFSLPLREF
ncbi:MAG TPA: 4'-phosphopantetheinyl transferase superfamily protein, partial [Saprospiraceae bacterium]|nr:4'-phosphopantetheinyl transferase superfamily protein [Saprospiraceae bacterium]